MYLVMALTKEEFNPYMYFRGLIRFELKSTLCVGYYVSRLGGDSVDIRRGYLRYPNPQINKLNIKPRSAHNLVNLAYAFQSR